jgi:cytosine/adenosine deaminase-related metal-dependent hydrolase
MAFALKARMVFPVDQPPIEGGAVTIDGERIVAVGVKAEAGEITDLGDVAMLPGLVNAHTHLEFSHLQKPLGKPGMRLVDWIRLVIAERGRNDISPFVSMLRGWSDCVDSGATSICDVATKVVSPGTFHGDVITAVEVIGFSRARAASAFSALIEQLEYLERVDGGYVTLYSSGAPFAISPHAPYTVSHHLLGQLIDLASTRKLPVAMHIAESPEELELLRDGTGPFQELLNERSMWDAEAIPHGGQPLDYLRMLSESPRALVIHGNYLNAEEHAYLAKNSDRMSLVYCPRTHAYFQHPKYPLSALLESGVRVALGTDSRASNPDLDLLAEMRYVAQAFPAIDPQMVLRLGTLAGAEALGRDAEVGSITPGKRANLIAIPIDSRIWKSADDSASALLIGDQKPSRIWIRGTERN